MPAASNRKAYAWFEKQWPGMSVLVNLDVNSFGETHAICSFSLNKAEYLSSDVSRLPSVLYRPEHRKVVNTLIHHAISTHRVSHHTGH